MMMSFICSCRNKNHGPSRSLNHSLSQFEVTVTTGLFSARMVQYGTVRLNPAPAQPVVVNLNARRAPPEFNAQRRNTFLTLLAAATALGLVSSSFAETAR